jgi:hypothetical protein
MLEAFPPTGRGAREVKMATGPLRSAVLLVVLLAALLGMHPGAAP